MTKIRSTPRSNHQNLRVQQAAGQHQQAAHRPQPAEGLRRKAWLLAAGLLTTARNNPGSVLALGGSILTAKMMMQETKHPNHGLVSIVPLGKNPRPEGVELLVVDESSHPGGHGDWSSFVANSNIDKTQNIETLLLENGLSPDLCERLEHLIHIAKMQNPPEVISMSLGFTPARKFELDVRNNNGLKHVVKQHGADTSKWPLEKVKDYKNYLKQQATVILKNYANDMNIKCKDGTHYSQKKAEVFKALTNAGVTVVLCAGNDGRVEAIMNDVGQDVPEGLFSSYFYSNGEFLPDGVIVVGGSRTLINGKEAVLESSNPNPAVDVLANGVAVQVNAKGDTKSGTSFSAPRVAALAANILAINPRLTPADVEEIIVSTATPLYEPKGKSGKGAINESKALDAARKSLLNKNS